MAHTSISPERGEFTAENQSVQQLIHQAYGLGQLQVEGGPTWMAAERFDVRAKAAGAASKDSLMQMLQMMLEDRFQLAFRR